MKNMVTLAETSDVTNFVFSLWQSDLFRDNHQAGGFIAKQVDKFAYLPRIFAHMTNDHLERAHFSTWWNVIMLRDDYTNPIIHDLYYLHEMTHAASMPYFPECGKEAFWEKMERNELEASVMSEIAVYLHMPELRSKSFDHPIYADRFLADNVIRAVWDMNPDVAIEMIRLQRRNVMISKPETGMDFSELWIRRFSEQNAVYNMVWADRYQDIELRMAAFQWTSRRNRAEAIVEHQEWVDMAARFDHVDNIPFREEAELFSPFYWSNKAKHNKAISE